MKKYFISILTVTFAIFLFFIPSFGDDIGIIKNRIVEELLNKQINEARIESILNTINDGIWPEIDYADVSNEGFQHVVHLRNILDLSIAFNKKTSSFFEHDEVLHTIKLALDHWTKNDYKCDNWWNNEIGTPNSLVETLLLIGDELSKSLIDSMRPIIERANVDGPGGRPGGDRIKIAGIQAKYVLFNNNEEEFFRLIKIIESEIKPVEWIGNKYGYTYRFQLAGFANRAADGRGIQYDNSFHHRVDGVNNTLSYGMGYAHAFIEWASYTRGTKFAFEETQLQKLIDYYLDGISKTAVFGKFMEVGAMNRDISRPGAVREINVKDVERLSILSQYRKDELDELIQIRKGLSSPTLSHATYFWNTEHFSFQRPNWFSSVRLYSKRNYNMESPYNSEGILNHHRGDGANYVYVTGLEYKDIFPVYNFQKISGATIMQKPDLPPSKNISRIGETNFVGAVTDGVYGAVAFDFKSPHDPLIGRKSWFYFDEEYVCLGSGISCRNDSLAVFTTVNQSLLAGDVMINQNGEIVKGLGETTKYRNPKWILHDNIGYVFPDSSSLYLSNQIESGSWWRISHQTSTPKDEIKKGVFKLWFDHGKRPSDEKYEYIVVPDCTLGKLSRYESSNSIKILKNTAEIQAVMNTELGICQVVFYEGGTLNISDNIQVNSYNPGIIMLKIIEERIVEISVSDPGRNLLQYNLSLTGKYKSKSEGNLLMRDKTKGITHMAIDLPQGNYTGKSVTLKF